MAPTITFTETLVAVVCPVCGVHHAIPQAMNVYMLDHPRTVNVYCPNGHQWYYTGKSDAEKAREERDNEIARRRAVEDQLAAEKRANKRAEAARKRAEKRAKAGVCPCCNRSFVQMERHMRTKHPDYGA